MMSSRNTANQLNAYTFFCIIHMCATYKILTQLKNICSPLDMFTQGFEIDEYKDL